MNKAIEISNFH